MKKLFATAFLLLSLALFAFADGGVPVGGRQCPPAPEPCPTSVQREETKTTDKVGLGFRILREILRIGFRI